MSNELIEKVARALYAIEWSELGGPYDEQDEIDKTYWMRGATAAVNLVLEAAAEYHDKQITETEAQMQRNSEYRKRSGSTSTEADDFCRATILHHRISAAAIRQMKVGANG